MKHILITGGSDGLGKITAQKLKAADNKITILAHNVNKVKGAAEEIGCEYVVADVFDYEQVEKATKQATDKNGPIDILINNAGVWIQDALETNDPERIRRTIQINTIGPIFVTRAVVPSMKRSGKGRIINVISQAGISTKAERAVYNASKWAVTGFTKAMQKELKPFKISVVGFYPGALDTDLFNKAGYDRDMSKALDPNIAADSLVYVCQLPDDIDIPEIGIQDLNY